MRVTQRQYKAVSPVETVQRIREVFGRLDLCLYETIWRDIGGTIFSCQVNMERLDDICSYGKGRTERYALASACAEMVERIQNLMIFCVRVGRANREIFSCFPDTQEYRSVGELVAANAERSRGSVQQLCDALVMPAGRPIVGGCFYDVDDDCEVILPYSAIIANAGSNGMCAGNEPAEALVQGFCEIFERAVLRALYTEKVAPPDIPEDYYRDTHAYELVQTLQRHGVSVIVKDCSLGEGYPVVGVLLVHQNSGRYRFRLGSHTIFAYALERAITEAYQGFDAEVLTKVGERVELGADPFSENGHACLGGSRVGLGRDFCKSVHFMGQLRSGSNRAPATLFGSDASYAFQEWRELDGLSSYGEDLLFFKDFLRRKGFRTYVRDVSFLGFPSYLVYVTELSDIFSKLPWGTKTHVENMTAFESGRRTAAELKDIYSRLDKASVDELRDLVDYIKANEASPLSDVRERQMWLDGIFHYRVPRSQAVLQEYLLSLLYYRLGDWGSASKYMDMALKRDSVSREKHKYFYVFRDALHLLGSGLPFERLLDQLRLYYPAEIASGVLEDMKKKDALFEKVPVPRYEDYKDHEKLERIFAAVTTEAAKSKIRQLDLRSLFYPS